MATAPARERSESGEFSVDGQDMNLNDIRNEPKDVALLRMENDNITSMARAYPRNHKEVLDDIKEQLRTYRSFAEEAMYSKPVGKDENGKKKFARGLSIRSAEAIACAYKYNRVRSEVKPLDEFNANIDVSFVDYQTGRIWQDAGIVTRRYKDRYGKMQIIPEDRFWNVVVKAEVSRRIRECILRCVPPGLRSELERLADEQLDGFLDEHTVKKIVAQFSGKGVTQEMLEKWAGKRLDSLDKIDRMQLLGIWNAIKDDQVSVADAFGSDDDKAPPPTGRAEDFAKKLNTAGNGTEPTPETPQKPAAQSEPSQEPTPAQETPEKSTEAPSTGPSGSTQPVALSEINGLPLGQLFSCSGKIKRITANSVTLSAPGGITKEFKIGGKPEWAIVETEVHVSVAEVTAKGGAATAVAIHEWAAK